MSSPPACPARRRGPQVANLQALTVAWMTGVDLATAREHEQRSRQLVILEQKSFIRSMDRQLTFISLLVYLLLILSMQLKVRRIWQPLGMVLVIAVMLMAAVMTHPVGAAPQPKAPPYEQVLKELRLDPEFNGKIFSYPGDPLFYVYTQQLPPFYFTAYEATPRYAQEKLIKYMEENAICVVVENTTNSAIQDGVPNPVRSRRLLAFIHANFVFSRQIGPFAIYKLAIGCQR